MKKELTSIEIRFLVKELQDLIGAKIDQIYQPTKGELLLQLHVPGKGKQLLRIILPGFIFLTKEKPEMPQKISEFCTVLREHLGNSRIRSIKQIKNERIIEICLEKDKKYTLFIELFSKGNVILCQDNNILMALWTQKLSKRIIKKGKKYNIPENKYDVFDKNSFTKAIKNSDETISKIFAVKLGLGKLYAEELCLRAELNKLSKKITKEESEKLFKELTKLSKQPIKAKTIQSNNEIIDIIPIDLEIYSKYDQKPFKNYNSALASVLDKLTEQGKKSKALQRFTKRLEKIDTKINKQKQTLEKLKNESKENQRRGELIYENYQKIQKIVSTKKKHQKIKFEIN